MKLVALFSFLCLAAQAEPISLHENYEVEIGNVSSKLSCGATKDFQRARLRLTVAFPSPFLRSCINEKGELVFEGNPGSKSKRTHCEAMRDLIEVAKENGDKLTVTIQRTVVETEGFSYHFGKPVKLKVLETKYNLYFHLYAYLPFEAHGGEYNLEQIQ